MCQPDNNYVIQTMKITFVHRGREHLGIEYLSSMLKKAGHEIALAYDPGLFSPEDNVFNIPFLEKLFNQKKNVVSAIKDSSPDLVAFTVYSGTYTWACNIARQIRQEIKTQTIFGGIHATLVPETVIKNDFVDFVVVGEGFHALPELAEAISSDKGAEGIANLWLKKNGTVIKNTPRPPFEDLDSLPMPDKALFEKDVNYKDDYVIITSLGCAFSCSYCCESYLNKLYSRKFFRRRSIDSVMDELRAMKKKYNFKEVMFNDALFFTDKKWLMQLMEKYRKEINVPFRCFGKVTNLDDEICHILKDSGCYCIEFGMQTVNQNLKKEVLHRNETNKQAFEAFARCDRYKLHYDIDHMFGLPGETEEDHIQGLKYYSRLKYLNRIKCHNLTYFPQTAIIHDACRNKMLSDQDIENINKGEITDFFHSDFIRDSRLKKAKDNFSKLYKLLPILPYFMVHFLINLRLYRVFRFIPAPVIILGQLLVAAKGRDYRFIIYFKYYPLRICRSLKNKFLLSRKKDDEAR